MESRRFKEVSLKDEIFEKAAELFSRKGYDNVSVREIAEACNVTKPALYYYFDSKETLAKSLIDALIDRLHERLTEIRDNPPDNPLDLLTQLVMAYFDIGEHKAYLTHFMVTQLFSGSEHDLCEHIARRHNVQEEIVREAMKPFVEQGYLVPNAEIGFTVTLLGTMLIMHLSHIHKDLKGFTPELARCVAADMLYGFCAHHPHRLQNKDLEGIHSRVANLWEIKK